MFNIKWITLLLKCTSIIMYLCHFYLPPHTHTKPQRNYKNKCRIKKISYISKIITDIVLTCLRKRIKYTCLNVSTHILCQFASDSIHCSTNSIALLLFLFTRWTAFFYSIYTFIFILYMYDFLYYTDVWLLS